ncbi:FAD-dependent oxidoreductase [Achromobacter aloeverae]
MHTYPSLLSELRIGALTLPNRMVMGAMHTRLETLDQPQERLAAFYVARARGEVGLILSGGYSPVPEGVMESGGPLFNSAEQIRDHRLITSEVRRAGGRIVLQILHAGRYAKVPECVAPSEGKARINSYSPRALTTDEVWNTIERFAHTAALAQEAGYCGIEVMGSEGYLINEFTTPATNQRTDEFGRDFAGRARLPLEIVKAIRRKVGPEFLIIYRISAVDLVDGGMIGDEVAALACLVEEAGADVINTGIGWHEAAIPTIAAAVPRAAWVQAVRNVKQAVSIPVMASNRINTPEIAEEILASGVADLVSMARPLLADPLFAHKVRLGKAETINTCIACNQACLDQIFTNRTATCLVNPQAGREIEFSAWSAANVKHFGVVGGGAAGMAFALHAAQRGHRVTLYEAAPEIGGQLNLARRVPGKSEFSELLRYFSVSLRGAGVDLRLGHRAAAQELADEGFDAVIIASGVTPRRPDIQGIEHPKVVSYQHVLGANASVGQRVAIIGGGGIGFDVAAYLLGDDEASLDVNTFFERWGIDATFTSPGGLAAARPSNAAPREIHMFQRKPGSFGGTLGKSTGWILKAKLRNAQVRMNAGVSYHAIDDQGLHYSVDGMAQVCPADTIIVCAGQDSQRELYEGLQSAGVTTYLIGGADTAHELDAMRAIDQATRLAMSL